MRWRKNRHHKDKKIGRRAARFFLGKYDAEPYKYPTTPKNLADRAAKLEHECKSNEKLLTKKEPCDIYCMRKLIFNIFLSFFSAFAGCPKFRKRACACESGKKSGETRSSFILEKHDIKFYKYPLFVKTQNLFFWYIFRKRSKKRGRLFFLYLVKI